MSTAPPGNTPLVLLRTGAVGILEGLFTILYSGALVAYYVYPYEAFDQSGYGLLARVFHVWAAFKPLLPLLVLYFTVLQVRTVGGIVVYLVAALLTLVGSVGLVVALAGASATRCNSPAHPLHPCSDDLACCVFYNESAACAGRGPCTTANTSLPASALPQSAAGLHVDPDHATLLYFSAALLGAELLIALFSFLVYQRRVIKGQQLLVLAQEAVRERYGTGALPDRAALEQLRGGAGNAGGISIGAPFAPPKGGGRAPWRRALPGAAQPLLSYIERNVVPRAPAERSTLAPVAAHRQGHWDAPLHAALDRLEDAFASAVASVDAQLQLSRALDVSVVRSEEAAEADWEDIDEGPGGEATAARDAIMARLRGDPPDAPTESREDPPAGPAVDAPADLGDTNLSPVTPHGRAAPAHATGASNGPGALNAWAAGRAQPQAMAQPQQVGGLYQRVGGPPHNVYTLGTSESSDDGALYMGMDDTDCDE